MTLIIVANAVIMALDHYPIAETQLNLISIFNQLFSWIFVCEMIVKLTGLGFKEYVRDSFNRFDAVIVIISVVDNVIFYSVGNRAGGGGVIILRSIRLLRVLKLARNWTSLRILINKMIDTLPNLASFAFLLLIFQIVFIILGLQFFSGTVYLD
jgi:Ion transport protein